MERLAPEEEPILVFDNIDNAQLFAYWKAALIDFNKADIGDEMYPTLEGIHHVLAQECIDRGLTEWLCTERDIQMLPKNGKKTNIK